MTDTAERSHVMSLGFNMQAEFTKLAQRIVAPVAAKLTMQELEHIVGEIGYAFEQFNARHTTGDTDFQNTSVSILEPVRPKLSGTDFARIVDRLSGAVAGFCQRDEAKAQPNAEPWGLQQAGQHAQSEPETEPWWSTSEQAMALLILLWLCTGIDWQLH